MIIIIITIIIILLSASLFPGVALDATWAAACSELYRAIERLKCIGSQDALILQHSSCSVLHAFNIFCDVLLLFIIRLCLSLMNFSNRLLSSIAKIIF